MAAAPPGATGSERTARMLALLSLLALVAAGVALYAWIQIGSPEPASGDQASVLATLAPSDDVALAPGDTAPGFSATLFGGGTFDLARHLVEDGRPVFLNLWASWCLPCREEMPAIDAAAQRHPRVHFLGVAVEDRLAAAQAFAEEIDVGYALGFDDGRAVATSYPVLGMPATFLISAEGVVLQRIYGQVEVADIDAILATHFGG